MFCVSSKHYRSNVAGYWLDQSEEFPVGANTSGILALKRVLATLATQGLQRGLLPYVETIIPNLLSNLEMVSSVSTTTSSITIPGGLKMQLEVRPQKAWQTVLTVSLVLSTSR
jgi:hypothetical protein